MGIRTFWQLYIKPQPAWAFLRNFLLMMVIFTICRIFFFLVNKSYFTDVDFSRFLVMLKGGLQFDLTGLLYLNLPYLAMQLIPFRFRLNAVYQKIAKWLFIIVNSIAVIANCADIPFFRFTNRRTTSTIFSEFKNEDNIFKIVLESMFSYWYVTLFVIVVIFILYKLYYTPQSRKKTELSLKQSVFYYTFHTVLLVVFVYFSIVGMRGGFGMTTRPITLSNANTYVKKSSETAIVLNTPFSILRTINKDVYKNPKYFSDENEMKALYSPIHQFETEEEFKPMNVVVLILESFGKEYFGFFNKHLENGTYKGYTPFLDSLCTEGLTYQYSYSNGRKSIDGMPSTLSSIPMFVEPFILTPYSTNDISSIADALKQEGYYSAFFHGAPNGSMGFQAYANLAGFDDYFGLDEYNADPNTTNAFDGWWSIWDEEFLQFYADKMGEMKQPFVTSVFTASSHHPFNVPKRYEGVFPEGPHPIYKCIGYSDNAVRRFFEKMSTYDWYNNTLFVITADHTNYVGHEEYTTDANLYAVPILFYHPGSDLKGFSEQPAQQTDIMPSVLSYLNYSKPFFAYGDDIINKHNENKFVVNYNNQVYQFYQHDYFLQFDGEKTKGIYNFKTDTLLKENLVGKVQEQPEMELLLKSVIQQYIINMTENKLRVENK